MAFPTSTRAELRRAICLELGMPFFRRYANYLNFGSGSTGVTVINTDLAQADNTWKNMWFYVASVTPSTSTGATADSGNLGAVRLITEFSADSDALTLEYDLTATPETDSTFEIHNVWNAHEIHGAINRAIREAFPHFFNIVTDETLVLEEYKLSYDISALTYRPWIIADVYVERPTSSMSGTASATSTTSLTDSTADFSGVDTNYKLSIYSGTGSGQIKSVASVIGTTQINVTTWTTTPDTTSKYKLWDASEEKLEWYRLTSLRFDSHEFPSTMYLTRLYPGAYGYRFRLKYATDELEMDDDDDTTAIPKEYIIYKAIEFLAASRVASSKADREEYAVMEQLYRSKAEDYKERHAFRLDTNLWQEYDANRSRLYFSETNPLEW